MITIKHKEEKVIDVTLSQSEALEVTIKYLQTQFDFVATTKFSCSTGFYGHSIIDGGVVAHREEYLGRHCRDATKKVRDATEYDIAVEKILRVLCRDL